MRKQKKFFTMPFSAIALSRREPDAVARFHALAPACPQFLPARSPFRRAWRIRLVAGTGTRLPTRIRRNPSRSRTIETGALGAVRVERFCFFKHLGERDQHLSRFLRHPPGAANRDGAQRRVLLLDLG